MVLFSTSLMRNDIEHGFIFLLVGHLAILAYYVPIQKLNKADRCLQISLFFSCTLY